MSDVVTTRREGGILEVTLDRPKANAIDLVTSRIMGETFRDFRDDPELRVAIVRTAGERFFSAGWDLKAAAGGDDVDGDYGVGGFAGLQELRDLNKPVIAAVNGMAVGGGFELALSADMILATENVTFALPEIRAGTLADAATVKLPKRIPYHVAMDLLLTGRWMDVQEAHKWGLVNEVLADEQALMDRAWDLARLLESGPPLVFASIKEVARAAEAMTFQDAMNKITKRQFATVDVLYGSEDGMEGFKAQGEQPKIEKDDVLGLWTNYYKLKEASSKDGKVVFNRVLIEPEMKNEIRKTTSSNIESYVIFLYWILMEASIWQASVGKRMMGLKVVNSEGGKPSWPEAAARSTTKFLACWL